MIELLPNLSLTAIEAAEAPLLLPLMKACYPPVYAHLWGDGGGWYLKESYDVPALLTDLAEADAPYYWVKWQGQPVGILRMQVNQESPDFPGVPALKLQRIYLHPRVHGKGIGRAVMDFVAEAAVRLQKSIVWLEAMDTQVSAHQFYEKMDFRKTGNFRLTYERMHPHYRGMVRMTKEL